MNHPHNDAVDTLLRQQFDGPVPDDGFSNRMMQRLPLRRCRVEWPLWAGLAAGVAASWFGLVAVPLVHVGWRDLIGCELSSSAITLLLAIAGMSLLTCWWTIAEPDEQ